jgi:hypothetical protein
LTSLLFFFFSTLLKFIHFLFFAFSLSQKMTCCFFLFFFFRIFLKEKRCSSRLWSAFQHELFSFCPLLGSNVSRKRSWTDIYSVKHSIYLIIEIAALGDEQEWLVLAGLALIKSSMCATLLGICSLLACWFMKIFFIISKDSFLHRFHVSESNLNDRSARVIINIYSSTWTLSSRRLF